MKIEKASSPPSKAGLTQEETLEVHKAMLDAKKSGDGILITYDPKDEEFKGEDDPNRAARKAADRLAQRIRHNPALFPRQTTEIKQRENTVWVKDNS